MKIKSVITAVLAMALVACMFAGCSSSEPGEEIAASDAVNLMKTYTAEELGVEGELEDYSILSSSDKEIDGETYYEIAIAIVSEPDENDNSVDIDFKARFYVSYDGSKILQYDEENDTYTEFKDVHDIPEPETVADTYVDEDEEAEADTEAEEEAEVEVEEEDAE